MSRMQEGELFGLGRRLANKSAYFINVISTRWMLKGGLVLKKIM